MIEHKSRAHALLSASSAHRWLKCTPSVVLEQEFPDTTSDAAMEGTVAHELCEMKIRNYFYTTDYGKRKMNADIKKLKANTHWNDEMMGYTDVYLDYIKKTAMEFSSSPYVAIEKKVDFSAYVPEGFGTADCILIHGDIIHIIDFKYGKGVSVSAEKNPQLMLYALGAYEAYKILYPIKKVKMTIVQPRLDDISEYECSLEELLKFGEYAKSRAYLAINGDGEYSPDEEVCRFCRAKGACRARAERNVELAFGDHFGKLPPLISNEEVGGYIKKGEDVAKWLSDLKDYALKECLAGREVPGWKAVEGRALRDWTNMDEAFNVLKDSGYAEEILYERKPLTIAQCEKAIGKKEFVEKVGDYVTKKPGKPTLVESSDKRQAITNKVSAEEAFGE